MDSYLCVTLCPLWLMNLETIAKRFTLTQPPNSRYCQPHVEARPAHVPARKCPAI